MRKLDVQFQQNNKYSWKYYNERFIHDIHFTGEKKLINKNWMDSPECGIVNIYHIYEGWKVRYVYACLFKLRVLKYSRYKFRLLVRSFTV